MPLLRLMRQPAAFASCRSRVISGDMMISETVVAEVSPMRSTGNGSSACMPTAVVLTTASYPAALAGATKASQAGYARETAVTSSRALASVRLAMPINFFCAGRGNGKGD